MTNLEFYKEEIKQHFKSIKSTYHNLTYDEMVGQAIRITYNANTGNIKKSTYINYETLLDWLCEEHQILDKEEKEYLSNVIRLFKGIVRCIYKKGIYDKECISIAIGYSGDIIFPCFKADTMYKGMELNKEYTLEELGL